MISFSLLMTFSKNIIRTEKPMQMFMREVPKKQSWIISPAKGSTRYEISTRRWIKVIFVLWLIITDTTRMAPMVGRSAASQKSGPLW